MQRHHRSEGRRQGHPGPGPTRARGQRLERGAPVGTGCHLPYGQQQPLVARRRRTGRNPRREHFSQQGGQPRAVRHGTDGQSARRTQHYAAAQYGGLQSREERQPHDQPSHSHQSPERHGIHARRRSVRRLYGRRHAGLPRRGIVPHGRRGERGVRRRIRPRQTGIRRIVGTQHPFLHEGHRPPGEIHGAGFRHQGCGAPHPQITESQLFQPGPARLQILVAGIRRPSGHGDRHRADQIRTLARGLRRLGLHQELRQVPAG